MGNDDIKRNIIITNDMGRKKNFLVREKLGVKSKIFIYYVVNYVIYVFFIFDIYKWRLEN